MIIHPSGHPILQFDSTAEAIQHFKRHGDFLDRSRTVKGLTNYFFVRTEPLMGSVQKTFFMRDWFSPTSVLKNELYIQEAFGTFDKGERLSCSEILDLYMYKSDVPKNPLIPEYKGMVDLLQAGIAYKCDFIELVRAYQPLHKYPDAPYTHPSGFKILTFSSELEANKHFEQFGNFLSNEPDLSSNPYYWIEYPSRVYKDLIYKNPKKYNLEAAKGQRKPRKCWNIADLPTANNTAEPSKFSVPDYNGVPDLIQAAVAYNTSIAYLLAPTKSSDDAETIQGLQRFLKLKDADILKLLKEDPLALYDLYKRVAINYKIPYTSIPRFTEEFKKANPSL